MIQIMVPTSTGCISTTNIRILLSGQDLFHNYDYGCLFDYNICRPMEKNEKPFEFNLPEPIRIKEYSPVSQFIDYSHPNYLYEGNKYRTQAETARILLDQQMVTTLYNICFKESLKNPNSGQDMLKCYKQKLAIFRDIIQILNEPTSQPRP